MAEGEPSNVEPATPSNQMKALLAAIRSGTILDEWAAMPFTERLRAKVLIAALHLSLQSLDDSSMRPTQQSELPHFLDLSQFGNVLGSVSQIDPESFSLTHPLRSVALDLRLTVDTLQTTESAIKRHRGLNQRFV